MTEMHPERPIEAVEIAGDTGFVLPMVPASRIVRLTVEPYVTPEVTEDGDHILGDPIVMEMGQLDPEAALKLSVIALITTARRRFAEAGSDPFATGRPGGRFNPVRGIGRVLTKSFSAAEPVRAERRPVSLPMFDPLSGRLTLTTAVRWTEGQGQLPPELAVKDMSRGPLNLDSRGYRRRTLEIDPLKGVLKRATLQRTEHSPVITVPTPLEAADIWHANTLLERSVVLPGDVFDSTQAFGVETVADVRRIVGIEWQPPEPPDRSWQQAE